MVAFTILTIVLAFIALFVLPFFFVSSKVFRDKDIIFRIYASMAIGLFTSIAIVYLLIGLGIFTKIGFLIAYLPFIAIVNFYFLWGSKWKDFNFHPRLTIPTILLIIAFCLGFYLRFYEPITNVSLAGSDPWAHLLWAKQVVLGDVLASGKWGWDYPKGLHAILSLIHFYSGISIYSVLRFAGAFFGVVSIGAVYCLVSYIGGRYAGAFASLAYSGFQYTSSSSILIARQTLTMPEPLAFILVPLILLFALEIVKDLHREKIQKRNIALFLFITISFCLIHNLTFFWVFYLLFLLFILALIFYKNIRRNIKSILLLIILFSLGIWITLVYYRLITVAFHQIYAILFNGYLFQSSFAPLLSMISIPTPTGGEISIIKFLQPTGFNMSIHLLFVLLLSFGIALYGVFKRKLNCAFVGASGILFSFMTMTGCFIPPHKIIPNRSGEIFSFITSCMFGIAIVGFANRNAIGEILKKIGNISRYTRWLGKISQTILYTSYYVLFGIGVSGWMCWGIFNRMNYAHPLRMAAPIALIVGGMVFLIVKIKSMRKNKRLARGKRPGISDQRIFKIIVTISFFLVLFTPAMDPYTNYVGHHGYDDFVATTLNICDEFPLNKVAIYSAPIRINREEPIIYPDGLHYDLSKLVTTSPDEFVPERNYTFLYIEKNIYPTRLYYEGNESIETMEDAKEWISNYKENHVDISVYYESKNIIVYIIEKG